MFGKKHSIITIFCLTLMSFYGYSQEIHPVTWTFDLEKNTEGDIVFRAESEIEENWNVYSLHIDPGGPIATSFRFDAMENLGLDGALMEEGNSKTEMDEMFSMELKKFKNNATFTQRFDKTSSGQVRLNGFVTFMCCNDKQCLPPTDVAFDLKVD